MNLYGQIAGHGFDGARFDSWVTHESQPTSVGFTMDDRCFSLPLHEISEITVDLSDPPRRPAEVKLEFEKTVTIEKMSVRETKAVMHDPFGLMPAHIRDLIKETDREIMKSYGIPPVNLLDDSMGGAISRSEVDSLLIRVRRKFS